MRIAALIWIESPPGSTGCTPLSAHQLLGPPTASTPPLVFRAERFGRLSVTGLTPATALPGCRPQSVRMRVTICSPPSSAPSESWALTAGGTSFWCQQVHYDFTAQFDEDARDLAEVGSVADAEWVPSRWWSCRRWSLLGSGAFRLPPAHCLDAHAGRRRTGGRAEIRARRRRRACSRSVSWHIDASMPMSVPSIRSPSLSQTPRRNRAAALIDRTFAHLGPSPTTSHTMNAAGDQRLQERSTS